MSMYFCIMLNVILGHDGIDKEGLCEGIRRAVVILRWYYLTFLPHFRKNGAMATGGTLRRSSH